MLIVLFFFLPNPKRHDATGVSYSASSHTRKRYSIGLRKRACCTVKKRNAIIHTRENAAVMAPRQKKNVDARGNDKPFAVRSARGTDGNKKQKKTSQYTGFKGNDNNNTNRFARKSVSHYGTLTPSN